MVKKKFGELYNRIMECPDSEDLVGFSDSVEKASSLDYQDKAILQCLLMIKANNIAVIALLDHLNAIELGGFVEKNVPPSNERH